jgi:hypothetical protein
MKKPEGIFQEHCINAFERLGAKVFNVHGHSMQASGWPDLQVYHPRWTGHLELKVDKNTCSTLQKLTLRDLRHVGTKAFVLRLEPDKSVRAELEDCTLLATLPASVWLKDGMERTLALFDLIEVASGELRDLAVTK